VRAGALALVLLALSATAAAAADEVRFVACPVYRDTDAGKKSGCWLADDRESGVRYDVSPSPTKPDWNYAVLVEGRPAKNQADVCGGVVLDPVRASILPEPCVRAVLPAEGYPGRRFVLPERNVRPLYEPRRPFPQPLETRTFEIPFEFGRSFITYQLGDYLIDQAVAYAVASHAARVEITGWAATTPAEVSGHRIAEPASVARARAEVVAQWMTGLGVPADRVKLAWRGAAQPVAMPGADGLVEPSRRRVDIRVVPESASGDAAQGAR
jgi:outer membrane protein OmpA-like peptidoglycan-associated protein